MAMSCEESGSLGRKSRTEMMSDEEVEMHVRPRRKSRESLSPAPPPEAGSQKLARAGVGTPTLGTGRTTPTGRRQAEGPRSTF